MPLTPIQSRIIDIPVKLPRPPRLADVLKASDAIIDLLAPGGLAVRCGCGVTLDLKLAMRAAWELAYPTLVQVDIVGDNPLRHHVVVLANAGVIGLARGLSPRQMLQLLSAAVFHDASTVSGRKITGAEIEELRKAGRVAEADALELIRKFYRYQHQAASTLNASGAMLSVNRMLHTEVYGAEDVQVVTQLVSVHDYPSLRIPVPTFKSDADQLIELLTSADSLWMLSNPEADLERDGLAITVPAGIPQYRAEVMDRLKKNLKSVRKRTQRPAGQSIYADATADAIAEHWLSWWAAQLGCSRGDFGP